MIIVVVGRAGSGKTAVAKEICKLMDLPLVEMSTIVQNFLKASKEHRGEINKDIADHEKQDPDWLWKEVEREIIKVGKGAGRHCVLSGIREPYLLHKIRQWKWTDVCVVGLEVSEFNRYSRLCNRDGFVSVKEFKKIDNGTKEKDGYVGDNELGIDITLTGCNFMVNANGTLEEVRNSISKLFMTKEIITPQNVNVKKNP